MASKEIIADVSTLIDIDIMALEGGRCPPGLAARTSDASSPDIRPIIKSTKSV